ncbi:MAG: dicarboxylate/amino acid:cation symporter [Holosporales bacterium]|jgi:Na+/H+-dicarboxylate symporter|nr:dicarboxylate/amino acid:cation symporter [Holosporales bacterium]
MVLGSGYVTLLSAVCAGITGIMLPGFGRILQPFGEIFLVLISVSVIPITFSSVTLSVINIISANTIKIKISRIIFLFTVALVVASIIGIVCGVIFETDNDISKSKFISNLIFQEAKKSILVAKINDILDFSKNFNFTDFLKTLLPKNPFEAFAKGNVIQILSVSVLIGISVSVLNHQIQTATKKFLNILLDVFRSVLNLSTKILPVGIFLLISSNLSYISIDILWAMKKFCLSAGVSFLSIVLIALLLICIYSPVGLLKSISALKNPIIIAFSTCSNQATLPFLISSLTKEFKLSIKAVDLAIPLGVIMCRTGNAAYYAFVAVFMSFLYNEPLSFSQYEFIVFGAILTSLAASGATGIIAITMISIILDPLNLPMGSVAVVLIVVEPILDPIRTVTSLIMNAALSCVVVNSSRKREPLCA